MMLKLALGFLAGSLIFEQVTDYVVQSPHVIMTGVTE